MRFNSHLLGKSVHFQISSGLRAYINVGLLKRNTMKWEGPGAVLLPQRPLNWDLWWELRRRLWPRRNRRGVRDGRHLREKAVPARKERIAFFTCFTLRTRARGGSAPWVANGLWGRFSIMATKAAGDDWCMPRELRAWTPRLYQKSWTRQRQWWQFAVACSSSEDLGYWLRCCLQERQGLGLGGEDMSFPRAGILPSRHFAMLWQDWPPDPLRPSSWPLDPPIGLSD